MSSEEVRYGEGAEGFPHASAAPFTIVLGLVVLFVGLAVKGALPIGVGAVIFLFGTYSWTRDYAREFERGIIPEQKKELLDFNSGILALAFIVVSEIIAFGVLFGAFFVLKAKNGPWPPEGLPGLDVPYALGLTVVLLTSGLTMHWAEEQIKEGNRGKFHIGLVATVLLGLVFLAGQGFEYMHMVAEGMVPSAGTYASTFYALTGTHGAHVVLGLIMIGIVGVRSMFKGHFGSKRHLAVRTTSLYWHFVDAVWVFIVAFVYLSVGGA
ncbi:MAG: heme-copper oxidase subunit III [Halobacteria archaeon]|nr:heme-copper oxidase subunit III [Halobacteria archaeon]